MRLCRPAGHFTFDLDAAGLTAPSVERVTGADVAECFRDLVLGKVDVVTLDRSIAAREIARQRLAGRVTEVRGLATAQTLHVIAPKSNPEALAVLALIDEGLAELKFSGRWFDTVSRYVGLLNADIGWGAGAVWTPGNLSSAHFDGTPVEQGS